MRIAVVDGLLDRRLEYKAMLQALDHHVEILECISAEDALFSILDHPVDAIFSSAILPFRTASELAHLLKTLPVNIPVVVISEDASKALQAINAGVFDFLQYPVQMTKLKSCFEKLIRHRTQQLQLLRINQNHAHTKVKLNTIHGHKLIHLNELAYCQADGAYTIIFYSNGTTDLSSHYLGRIGKVLEEFQFARVSRSCIVNLRKINSIDRTSQECFLQMDHEVRALKISRLLIDQLEEKQLL